MNRVDTKLAGAFVLEPKVFGDARGYFMETYHQEKYAAVGLTSPFVQDNLSYSARGVLRGLHFQYEYAQGKLLQVLQGEIWDVAVDIRVGSPTFGEWTAVTLSSDNRRQFYVDKGFAHGFVVVSETALVAYKCTELYHPEYERSLRWDDPALGIAWPLTDVQLSTKDKNGLLLKDIPSVELPVY